ncbi:hypothetical protein BLOT_009083 [Blomia tropicalis]|nr:hypothetical protein BLOT_009083 [Blomia tropicalis]
MLIDSIYGIGDNVVRLIKRDIDIDMEFDPESHNRMYNAKIHNYEDSPYRRHRDLVLGLNNGNKNDNDDSIKYRSANLKNENDSMGNLLSISNIATVGIVLILLAALSILIVLFVQRKSNDNQQLNENKSKTDNSQSINV